MYNDLFFIFILKTIDKQCMLFVSCLIISFKTEFIRSYFLCDKYFCRRHYIQLMNLSKLNNRIEAKKKELIYLVERYGLTHNKVISFSQELDRLLNLLIKLKTQKKRCSL
ncbi:aspartyl-phosphate phosphatase Spo0E family protein [Bacillus thuringiensis]|uniref:Stage 0 sporulation protein n=2 Tax=Bacillus TaxID=1386 RepID=A0A9X6SJP9_BACTU|nr:stage 0 sporulation protein [Bacillus thuringiensis]PDY98737.1 aspartyl-phosphate phosphatase Spo0E family protein [Bacillus thuringiensis]PGV59047.1 aspartyl-phosphate phosphatase Spo0E family protein [Bacillus thuringiensis]